MWGFGLITGSSTKHFLIRSFFFIEQFQFNSILAMSGVTHSLDVMPQCVNLGEVGTLSGILEKVYFLLLKSFCSRFTSMLWVVILLHHLNICLACAGGQGRNVLVNFGTNFSNYLSRSSKAAPNHDGPFNIFYHWDEVSLLYLFFSLYTHTAVCSFQTAPFWFHLSINTLPVCCEKSRFSFASFKCSTMLLLFFFPRNSILV